MGSNTVSVKQDGIDALGEALEAIGEGPAEGRVVRISEAKRLLRAQGATGTSMASRFGDLSKARNWAAHPERTRAFIADIRRLCASGNHAPSCDEEGTLSTAASSTWERQHVAAGKQVSPTQAWRETRAKELEERLLAARQADVLAMHKFVEQLGADFAELRSSVQELISSAQAGREQNQTQITTEFFQMRKLVGTAVDEARLVRVEYRSSVQELLASEKTARNLLSTNHQEGFEDVLQARQLVTKIADDKQSARMEHLESIQELLASERVARETLEGSAPEKRQMWDEAVDVQEASIEVIAEDKNQDGALAAAKADLKYLLQGSIQGGTYNEVALQGIRALATLEESEMELGTHSDAWRRQVQTFLEDHAEGLAFEARARITKHR